MNVAVQELETLDENEYVDHGVWALSEQSITRRRREHFRTAISDEKLEREGLVSSAYSLAAPWLRSTPYADDLLGWRSYLRQLSEEPVNLSPRHARAVAVVWAKLSSRVCQAIRPPMAGPGGELGFQMAWKGAEYYLDIDVDENGHFEWYYRNRISNTTECSDAPENEPPETLIRLLVRFCLV